MRKFEEILPQLKNYDNFGWYVPRCDKDPVYKIYPDCAKIQFRPVIVNIKTGWHSEFVYRDKVGVHRIKEGVTEIQDDWIDNCYRGCCSRLIII